ncbi:MAG: glycosyltransferase family 4 protein [Clostridia bacterium]|nr:glycosyltransferase family 4 protein [Clostridia bacterium]
MGKGVLWIIDHYASEPKYAGYTRQYSLANELAKKGIKVLVIASSFSHFLHKYITNQEYLIDEISPCAKIVYFKTNSYEKNTSIKRFLGMRAFSNQVMKHSKLLEDQFGQPTWIIASSPHILSWEVGFKMSRKYNAVFDIEIRDFWPWELRSADDDVLHKMLYLYFDCIETKAFKNADKIICTTEHGANYCDDMEKPGKEKFVYIGQPMDCRRYDSEAIENYELIPEEIRSFIADDFFCVFSGYYMPYEGVMLMLEAAKDLPQVKFLFVGSGSEKENMNKFAQENQLNNVLIWDRIPKECIPALLKESDICLAYLYDEKNPKMFKYGMSKNKVNEYLYSGAITIMGFDSENNEVIESGGGFTFKPTTNEFTKYIKMVYEMTPEERREKGARSRKYMEMTHDTGELAKKYMREVLHVEA